ncbi:MAG: hypothetical protein K9G09_02395 [Pontimonas sp.]|nr:hypothetical protein [Pontimonas sp.]
MHPENQHIHGMLQALYGRSRGSIGFVDESYREVGSDGPAFYTVTATVLSAEVIKSKRDDYAAVVGASRWHTTDAYQSGLRETIMEFLGVLETHDFPILTAMQVEILPGEMEHARRECLIQAVSATVDAGCDVVVYERREDRKARNGDESLFSKAKRDGLLDRSLRVFPGSPGAENLLWGPDLAGWALRRLVTTGDRKWIGPLRNILEIVDASGSGALTRKRPQPAAAMGSGPDSSVGPWGEVKSRSSLESIAHAADMRRKISTMFATVATPVHDPRDLSQWLHEQFPRHKP